MSTFILFSLLTVHVRNSFGDTECIFAIPGVDDVIFDLSAIEKMGVLSAPDADNSDLKYYFQICANLTANCTEENPGVGCAQQWTDGSCTLWLAGWTDSANAVLPFNKSNPSDGVAIEFDNGEKCYSEFGVTHPYKSRFLFVCDITTNVTVAPASVDPHDKCFYEFTIRSKHACPENNTTTTTTTTVGPYSECIWASSDGDHLLNISSMIGQSLVTPNSEDLNEYYVFTPCSNSLKCDGIFAMAYFINGASFLCDKYLAVWENGVNEPKYSPELRTWQFVYTNGDPCDNFENVLIVEWVCDETARRPVVVKAGETLTCNYQLVINSTLACQ